MSTLQTFWRFISGESQQDIQTDSAGGEFEPVGQAAEFASELCAARDPTPYDDWRIILDIPAPKPKLGFYRYAAALADTIRVSEPRFAIGIFGGWGSGKSTLMQCIHSDLVNVGQDRQKIITVEFNAWRYEKEDHLIVPLLDTIQQAMSDWGSRHEPDREAAENLAHVIGAVTKALVSGFSFKLGIPGAATISFDANKAVKEAAASRDGNDFKTVPRSFYHATFDALQQAFNDFAGQGADRRIVVFIDDLDRCLPIGALQVIESMKLFFDLPGFVFVVGLDRDVVEWSVDQAYSRMMSEPGEEPKPGQIRGSDYLKKIFQVPFSLPTLTYEQLEEEFLEDICAQAALPPDQATRIRGEVLGHLEYLVTQDGINPRDVKRYINSYTMALKTWPPDRVPNVDILLALQTISFRQDWHIVKDALAGSTASFLQALNDRINEQNYRALSNLDPNLGNVPGKFLEYVAVGAPGHALIAAADQVRGHLEIGAPILGSEDGAQLQDSALPSEQGKFRDLRTPTLEAAPVDGTVNNDAAGQVIESLSDIQSRLQSLVSGPKGDLIHEEISNLKSYIRRFVTEGSVDSDVRVPSPRDWPETVNRAFDTVLQTLDSYFRDLRTRKVV